MNSPTSSTSSTDRIERSTLINAPVSRVWRALTNAEAFGNWFGAALKGKNFVAGQQVQGQITIEGYQHVMFEALVERIEPEKLFSYRWHPYGGIRAIDMATGKTIWDRPFGTARTNGPFGIPSMLPLTIGTPNNGGSVVTASGLIFIAAATDNLIRAIDLRSGKTLWTDTLPAGGQATPMTYSQNGKQYLVIMAGGHHFMETPIGDEVIAYALP